jgi:hypothetical protein
VDKVDDDDSMNLELDISDEDLEYMEENPAFVNTMERIGRDLQPDEEDEGDQIGRRKKKRRKMTEEDKDEENTERKYEDSVRERSSSSPPSAEVKGSEPKLEMKDKGKKGGKKEGKTMDEGASETLPSLPPEQLREIRVRRVKREIAEICVNITQNPEGEFPKLDDILTFCEDGDVLISTLALRSLCKCSKTFALDTRSKFTTLGKKMNKKVSILCELQMDEKSNCQRMSENFGDLKENW